MLMVGTTMPMRSRWWRRGSSSLRACVCVSWYACLYACVCVSLCPGMCAFVRLRACVCARLPRGSNVGEC
eukprot:6597722-Alexandrium_andersonii.AAC.1